MFSSKDRERCAQIYDKYYSGVKFHDAFYREFIHKYLPPGGRLLDAGCGRYLKFSKELARTSEVVGIDLESKLETQNQGSPYGVRGDLNYLPFTSGHFDLIISRFVVEHLEHPNQVFAEFHRVLKPGGKVILLTPSKYDYVSLIAAITPYSWHRSLVSRIFRVSEDDVYPTFYRANTPSKIAAELKSVGLRKAELRMVNHYPAYLMFSPVLFRLGILYERLTSLEMFQGLRATILCVFEKEPAQNPAHCKEFVPGEAKLTSARI
jgi:ubiquinone/menaquinone biosynthesis C-methylase UbiE